MVLSASFPSRLALFFFFFGGQGESSFSLGFSPTATVVGSAVVTVANSSLSLLSEFVAHYSCLLDKFRVHFVGP